MLTESEYQLRKTLVDEIRELAIKLFGNNTEAEIWLETKTDSFWNMSPYECVLSGKGEEVLALLEEKTRNLNLL